MKAIVVSDTSPLRALQHLGLLGILESLFDEVIIPPAVRSELERSLAADELRVVFSVVPVRILSPADRNRVLEFQRALDPGESEALALAVELKSPVVLMDEADGRRFAIQLGITPLGVLGLLLEAKSSGFVPVIAPLIGRLQSELQFRLSKRVIRETLLKSGEGVDRP